MEDGRTAVEVRAISRVTLWGAITNLVLAAIKIVVGVLGHSQALVADGIHSLSDLASDAVVYFASKEGSRGPDREHPYGHARVETLATVAMGVILGIVALGIIVDGVKSLWIPDSTEPPGLMVLLMAFASLGAKEGLYRWTLSVAQRVQSQLLKANAWHHRSDAASSLVVVIAVVGAMVGLPWLDAVGAIGIAAMIAWMGWGLGHRSVRELVDTGLEPDQVEETRNAIMSVEGVKALHMLRTRRMGGKALVDVHILLEEPRISVSEGHQISETVLAELVKRVDSVTDVTVHIDPEDDERSKPNCSLPLRRTLLKRLRGYWAPIEASQQIQDVNLHYLEGKVHVEVILPLALAQDPGQARVLAQKFSAAVQDHKEIGEVRLLYR